MDGGIDVQNINVVSRSGSTKVQFNDQAANAMLKNGFNGFLPVIISITPVQNPLMSMGEREAEEREAVASVS